MILCLLLLCFLLPHPGRGQILEQLLSPEYPLTTQAAPTLQVLPALTPNPSQPESMALVERPILRLGVQVDDLMRIKTKATNMELRLNRLTTTVMGSVDTLRYGPITYGAEVLHTQGDEGRSTKDSVLDMDHRADSLRLSAFYPQSDEQFWAVQLVSGRSDIAGRTSLVGQIMKSAAVKPFTIDGNAHSLTATLGRLGEPVNYTVRLGVRTMAIPTTLMGTNSTMSMNFRGTGLLGEVRGWKTLDTMEGGALLAWQRLQGDDSVTYNGNSQGDTHASFNSLAVGLAGRYAVTPELRGTGQLIHQRLKINGNVNMLYPSTDDFTDFFGGTGIANGYLNATVTSLHVGGEYNYAPYTLRGGYQLAMLDLSAGFRYRTQLLGGAVRDQSAEETNINNGFVHILAGGVERTFPWGRLGYGLILTKPQNFKRTTRDLPQAFTRATTAQAAAADSSVKGGVVQTVRLEYWF